MFLGSIQHVFAQEFVPLAEIPGLTKGVVANSEGLAMFFNNLYKYLIGFAAMLAIIEIIWGGLEISTKDSVSKQSDGRERITQAIFGLILVLSPVLVFSIINPSILNLSLNLRPINLAVPPTTVPSSGGTCDPTTNTNNATCRQQLADSCTSSGGVPTQTYDPVSGKTTVKCGPANTQTTVVTANECASRGTPVHDGIVYASSVGEDCNSVKAVEYKQRLRQSCINLTGGGFCLYTGN